MLQSLFIVVVRVGGAYGGYISGIIMVVSVAVINSSGNDGWGCSSCGSGIVQ